MVVELGYVTAHNDKHDERQRSRPKPSKIDEIKSIHISFSHSQFGQVLKGTTWPQNSHFMALGVINMQRHTCSSYPVLEAGSRVRTIKQLYHRGWPFHLRLAYLREEILCSISQRISMEPFPQHEKACNVNKKVQEQVSLENAVNFLNGKRLRRVGSLHEALPSADTSGHYYSLAGMNQYFGRIIHLSIKGVSLQLAGTKICNEFSILG